MLLLALLSVVLSSCDTSEPSYTKQSFMNAKEHSNTENSIPKKCRGIQFKGNSIPKLILRRSKPSFQPSIPNIHLTSQNTNQRQEQCIAPPLRLGLSPLAKTPSETLYHHCGEQCTTQHVTKLWMCMHKTYTTITKGHLSGKHDVCNSHDFPKLLSPKKSMHVYTPFLLTRR